jgi:hypothetical protein
VELLVALAVFAVALAMTAVIITGISSSASTTLRSVQATDASLNNVQYVDQLIRDIVTHANAYLAESASAGNPNADAAATPTAVAGGPCWGSTTYEPAGASWQLPTGTPAYDLAVLKAYDSDIVFCAYRPGSTSATSDLPHIYEIRMVSPVSGASCVIASCTLQVLDWGTGTSAVNPFTATGAPVVSTIPKIWCDSWCQGCPSSGACSSGTATWPSGFSNLVYGYSCASLMTAGYVNPPGGCGGSTPPLYSFFGSSTTTALNSPTANLDMQSAQDAAGLFHIRSVGLSMTSLADQNAAPPVTGGSPGTSISDRIWLENLS